MEMPSGPISQQCSSFLPTSFSLTTLTYTTDREVEKKKKHREGEEEEAGNERRDGGNVTINVDMCDQLAIKGSVDLDSGIDDGGIEMCYEEKDGQVPYTCSWAS
ncbi:hypothetical protein Syun_014449 [Stephania yunnanensis]|uniref:Uncharacterized protein n=1 Tax=Stephania yunnanensis TaxID=152371 RepID=A0AAP0JJL1_9MAGN